MRKLVFFIFVGLVCLLLPACGPIKSTIIMVDVEDELKRAEGLEAEDKVASAYYYWAARAHLDKAWEEHGYSDFESSEEFAEKALELARKATEKTEKASKRVFDPDNPEPRKKKKKLRKRPSKPKKKSKSRKLFED